jgi:hypothetical protein
LKYGKIFSNWETINSVVSQGSILGPLIILLDINDLPLAISIGSKLLLYANDTSVLISGTDIQRVQTKSIIALDNIHKWFMRNGLYLNLKKLK